MKEYILGFKQEALVELEIRLDEALLLRDFVDSRGTVDMPDKVVNGKLFNLVTYKKTIEKFPILRITGKRSIANKYLHLVDVGILEQEIVGTQQGLLTYFRLTDKYVEIL